MNFDTSVNVVNVKSAAGTRARGTIVSAIDELRNLAGEARDINEKLCLAFGPVVIGVAEAMADPPRAEATEKRAASDLGNELLLIISAIKDEFMKTRELIRRSDV